MMNGNGGDGAGVRAMPTAAGAAEKMKKSSVNSSSASSIREVKWALDRSSRRLNIALSLTKPFLRVWALWRTGGCKCKNIQIHVLPFEST